MMRERSLDTLYKVINWSEFEVLSLTEMYMTMSGWMVWIWKITLPVVSFVYDTRWGFIQTSSLDIDASFLTSHPLDASSRLSYPGKRLAGIRFGFGNWRSLLYATNRWHDLSGAIPPHHTLPPHYLPPDPGPSSVLFIGPVLALSCSFPQVALRYALYINRVNQRFPAMRPLAIVGGIELTPIKTLLRGYNYY